MRNAMENEKERDKIFALIVGKNFFEGLYFQEKLYLKNFNIKNKEEICLVSVSPLLFKEISRDLTSKQNV